jgi:hypothetical protein
MGAFSSRASRAAAVLATICAGIVPASAGSSGRHQPAVHPPAPAAYPVAVVRPAPPIAALRMPALTTPSPAPAPAPLVVPVGGFAGPVVVLRETRIERVAPRPVRPLSFEVLDPLAVVGRSRSGRVVVVGSGPLAEPARAAPYAPASFQIIGAPSNRHMGGRVALNHGTPAPAGLETKPRVIWIKEPAAERPRALKPSG